MVYLHKEAYDFIHKKKMYVKILRYEKQFLCKVVIKGDKLNCGFLTIYGEIFEDIYDNYFTDLDYRFESIDQLWICLKRFRKDYRIAHTFEDVKWTRFST